MILSYRQTDGQKMYRADTYKYTSVLDKKQVFLSYVWQDLYFYYRAFMMVQHITFIKSQLIIFVDFFENYFFTQIFIVFPQKNHNILTFPA